MYSGDFTTAAKLVRMVLDGTTVLLCDGADVEFDGGGSTETYLNVGTLGSLLSVDVTSPEISDQLPGGTIEIAAKDSASAATLVSRTNQLGSVKVWDVEINPATGAVIDSDQVYTGLFNHGFLKHGPDSYHVEIELMTDLERIINHHEGNGLSHRFHQECFAGETGLLNATGVERDVNWGSDAPSRLVSAGGTGGGGGQPYPGRFPGIDFL